MQIEIALGKTNKRESFADALSESCKTSTSTHEMEKLQH